MNRYILDSMKISLTGGCLSIVFDIFFVPITRDDENQIEVINNVMNRQQANRLYFESFFCNHQLFLHVCCVKQLDSSFSKHTNIEVLDRFSFINNNVHLISKVGSFIQSANQSLHFCYRYDWYFHL